MYTQLIHPWEIEIFSQMIRLIPNYGYRHTCTLAQGLTPLIYFGGFKPPYTEIVKSRSGQRLMEGIRVIMHPMNPGAGDVAVLCRHLLDCDENVQTQVVVHSPGLFLNLVLKNCITVVLLDR